MARRFRFNLEGVLRYRGLLEDQRRREFAEASRRVEEERLRREELLGERAGIQDERSAEESDRRRREYEVEAEKRRQNLVAASRDRRVMESLKDRRREDFLREEGRREQSALDELSIQARARRLAEEAGGGGEAR